MVEIRNLKFQPLALHLANSKRSVHLPPRGRTEIEEKDISVEMRRAAERGFIVLRESRPAATPAKRPTLPPGPAPPQAEPKGESAAKSVASAKDTKQRR